MSNLGGKVWIAGTTKNMKVLIGRQGAIVSCKGIGHRASRVLVGSRLSRYVVVWSASTQKRAGIEA
jgi:hypothetical protein